MTAAATFNDPKALQRFRARLLKWYSTSKRSLPWRENRDPYRVWVSEIMLQQTRVAAVLDHYKVFLQRFPDVRLLANADESEVLASWSGLGYYRRARMMNRAAKVLTSEHQGEFPKSASELRQLPGIGRYTANAIASISFDEPVAVVDGNVERVLNRIVGRQLSLAEVWNVAQQVLDAAQPGDFNQAMMELGATVCVPGEPICRKCPVKRACSWSGDAGARVKANRVRKSAALLLATRRGSILLRQRSSSERLMPGMWELPSFFGGARKTPALTVRHSITITDWTVKVFVQRDPATHAEGTWVPAAKISQLPLTGLTRKILRRLELLA
jgi:A/G-specific adenine glycosylase